MKNLLLIATAILSLTGCADSSGNRTSSFTGKISTQGLQEITGAIQMTQALAGIYNTLGDPGLSASDAKAINAGIAAAAVINQAYVGQQIPASAINTGSPVVNAAMIASIKPGATGTQADANALSAASVSPQTASPVQPASPARTPNVKAP